MILAYKNISQILYTYAGILTMALVSFWVRSTSFESVGLEFNLEVTALSFVIVIVLWETLRFIDRYLDKVMPFEDGLTQRVVLQLAIGALFGLIVRFLIYYFGEPNLPFKLDKMFLATTWVIYGIMPMAINLGFFTAHFIRRWKKSLLLNAQLEREKSQVQFDNLKNQLNPHFLFNALTSLNSLIFEDQKLASEFLQQLSKVYRYVLQNKEKTMVSLDTELSFIQHYVSLLKTRFRDSLTIEFDIPDDALSRAIVPVTLQILIENALKHNIVDRAKPLSVRINISDDYLVVSNNLQEKKLVEHSNEQGLENLKTLYSFLSDKPLIITKDANQFLVKVPLI